jgi:AcrR family transcriptional regulator
MAPDMATHPAIKDEVAALKRERIIGAAAQLFYDRGYENSTLEAVAETMGVTKPFIYGHFKSKAELLADICTRGVSASLVAIDTALDQDSSPSGKLRLFARDFLIAVLNNQRNIAILTREEKNLQPEDFDRLSALRREFDHKLVSLLRSGVEAGEFRLNDPYVAALSIGGLVSWAYVWYRPHGRLSLDALADEVSTLILSMAGATS